jgi:hypothetical protein
VDLRAVHLRGIAWSRDEPHSGALMQPKRVLPSDRLKKWIRPRSKWDHYGPDEPSQRGNDDDGQYGQADLISPHPAAFPFRFVAHAVTFCGLR